MNKASGKGVIGCKAPIQVGVSMRQKGQVQPTITQPEHVGAGKGQPLNFKGGNINLPLAKGGGKSNELQSKAGIKAVLKGLFPIKQPEAG